MLFSRSCPLSAPGKRAQRFLPRAAIPGSQGDTDKALSRRVVIRVTPHDLDVALPLKTEPRPPTAVCPSKMDFLSRTAPGVDRSP